MGQGEKVMKAAAIASSFEMSLRILQMLNILRDTPLSGEQIGAIDFIAVYAADFDLLDENLHGYNPYRYSEYPARRALVSDAIKGLALDGYVALRSMRDGYRFQITQAGAAACNNISNSYATEYEIAIREVARGFNIHDLGQLKSAINEKTLESLKGNGHE